MNKKAWAIIAAIISCIYLLNPSAGILEVIPDNIPFIGNLDEASFTALLIWAISVLRGREVNFMGKKSDPVEKAKPARKADEV